MVKSRIRPLWISSSSGDGDGRSALALVACARDLVRRLESCERTLRHIGPQLLPGYVCFIAIDELRDFERMTQRERRADLDGWDAVTQDLGRGEAHVAHLWLPGRPPYDYDRVHEANQQRESPRSTCRA